MDSDKLIRMANQIGQFFASYPDRMEAEEGIVNHLKKFWDPRMRRALLVTMDADTTQEMLEIVKSAVAARRADFV